MPTGVPNSPSAERSGIWLGSPLPPDHYTALYATALQQGVRLLNTPIQHATIQQLDQVYPILTGLTPTSVVISQVDQCTTAIQQLGLPVFVRGALGSNLSKGASASVAHTLAELKTLTTMLLSQPQRSHGRVIVRQWVPLRHHRVADDGFPLGREYRVIVCHQQVLTYGYNWQGTDPLQYLTVAEEEELFAVALAASDRLGVPFVALDIGQLESGEWIVIDTEDPQCLSRLGQLPLVQLWTNLRQLYTPDKIPLKLPHILLSH